MRMKSMGTRFACAVAAFDWRHDFMPQNNRPAGLFHMIWTVLWRAWVSLAVAALLLGAATFFAWACYARDDIRFLADHSPARWIIYPMPANTGIRAGIPLDAVFRRSFSLPLAPARAQLRVCAFRTCTIQLNGKPVPARFDPNHWKQESCFDVRPFLQAGENVLTVTVTNASGPPALWLALSCPESVLASDPSWQVSLAGATWRPAALAADPVPFGNIDPNRQAGQVLPAMAKVWPMWLVFAGASAAMVWLCRRWLGGGDAGGAIRQSSAVRPQAGQAIKPRRNAAKRSASARADQNRLVSERPTGWWRAFVEPPGPHGRWRGLTRLFYLLIAIFWTGMFLHNSPYLSPALGFDAEDHLAYIDHFRNSWSIPLPGDAWGAQHPPLYYLLAATLLRVVDCVPDTASGILTVRLFNLVLALVNIYAILACLRLVFPEHPRRWVLGLVMAGFLPMFIYLYQTPLNHCLAGTLESVAIYFVLRILCAPNASTRDYALAGLALGAAVLTIVTASVLVVPVGAALLLKAYADRAKVLWRQAAWQILVLAAVVLTVCGWHYARVWIRLGTPIVGNMGFGVGTPFAWWQDPGYRTAGDYLRMGESLRSPLFSTWYSVWDGLYSSLWGDAYCGGRNVVRQRPPWSYDYVIAGMGLALAPTAAVLLGTVAAVLAFLRKPAICWAFLLGTAFAIALSTLYYPLMLPYYSCVKASYGIAMCVPLCLLAGLGFDLLAASSRWFRGAVFVILGTWAFNSAASYVVLPAATETQRYEAVQLGMGKHFTEAIAKLEPVFAAHPDDDITRVVLAALYRETRLDGPARQLLELPAGQCERSSRHYLLGTLLAGGNHAQDARREFQAAMELALDDQVAASAYAQVLSAGPDVRAAIEAWQNLLRIDPDSLDGHRALAGLYREVGDLPSAERHENYFQALTRWNQQKNSRRY
jgi:tetratricopeptide (TPR) repeat protein